MASDEEMLKKWLKNQKEKSFENGIKAACEYIFTVCEHNSMPVVSLYGNDNFYVSIDEVKDAINKCKKHYNLV